MTDPALILPSHMERLPPKLRDGECPDCGTGAHIKETFSGVLVCMKCGHKEDDDG